MARRTRGSKAFPFPEIGWIGFDPTNNLIAQDRHIRVAVGRDYPDVPPTRGVYKGCYRRPQRTGSGGAGRTGAVVAVVRRRAVHAVDVTRGRRGDAEARRATGSAATVEIRSCLFCATGDAPTR